MSKRLYHEAVRVLSIAICLSVSLALFSGCGRFDDSSSDHSAEPHSHADGHDHATAGFVCPMHPGIQQDTPGKCPKCGMDLERSSTRGGDEHSDHAADGHHHGSAEPTMTATAATAQPLRAGEKNDVTLVLKKKDSSPVTLDDLKEAHTEKIHVLIIDPTLTDYHHEHPVPGEVSGEYRFGFTPRTGGPYRMWADVVPATTGKQEYVIADLGGTASGIEIPDRSPKLTNTIDSLTYTVTFDGPLKAGTATLGRLTVKDANGDVFRNLEPIMGAYAHLVGFSEDYKTIAHIHPMGEEPKSASDRGTGDLQFHIEPEKAGLIRLFAQVQIDGQSRFAMFTLNVAP